MNTTELLIFSDSHGDRSTMRAALAAHPDADGALFLGDGLLDFAEVEKAWSDRRTLAVRGNCDLFRNVPTLAEFSEYGLRIALFHGHEQWLKDGDARLNGYAGKYDLILHGHTHIPRNIVLTVGGQSMTVFNPGAARDGRYGILTIREDGFTLEHRRIG